MEKLYTYLTMKNDAILLLSINLPLFIADKIYVEHLILFHKERKAL